MMLFILFLFSTITWAFDCANEKSASVLDHTNELLAHKEFHAALGCLEDRTLPLSDSDLRFQYVRVLASLGSIPKARELLAQEENSPSKTEAEGDLEWISGNITEASAYYDKALEQFSSGSSEVPQSLWKKSIRSHAFLGNQEKMEELKARAKIPHEEENSTPGRFVTLVEGMAASQSIGQTLSSVQLYAQWKSEAYMIGLAVDRASLTGATTQVDCPIVVTGGILWNDENSTELQIGKTFGAEFAYSTLIQISQGFSPTPSTLFGISARHTHFSAFEILVFLPNFTYFLGPFVFNTNVSFPYLGPFQVAHLVKLGFRAFRIEPEIWFSYGYGEPYRLYFTRSTTAPFISWGGKLTWQILQNLWINGTYEYRREPWLTDFTQHLFGAGIQLQL